MKNADKQLRTQQYGFTLIELVVVISILGILAATGIPKILSLRTEANIATLKTMGAAILSSANLVYSKATLLGVHRNPKTDIDLDGDGIDDVEVVYGYPSANRSNSISKIMDSDFATTWTWSTTYGDSVFWLTTAALAGRSGQYINQTAVRATNCYILYNPATSSAAPSVSYVTSGC